MRVKFIGLAAATASVLMVSAGGALAQFTQGNLVVSRVGDGSAALTSAGTAVFLDQFTTTGTLVSTTALPTTTSGSNRRIVNSGSATSEGFLSRSSDGAYLVYGGYDAAVGTASVVSTASTTNPRVIARIDSSGVVDTSTALTDAFSANNIRSVASTDGNSFFAAGANGGTRYTTLGATTSTLVSTTVTNERVVNIFNNQLYFSTGSGTHGIYQVGTGVSNTTGQTATLLVDTGSASSSYDFFLSSDALTLYVADDRNVNTTNANLGGGLQKYTRTSSVGSFSLAYTLTTGLSTAGIRSIAVDTTTAGGPTIYATTAAATNSLVVVTDNGAASAFATLATAGTNTAFRGLEFSPFASLASTPEPGTLALLSFGAVPFAARFLRRRAKKSSAA